MVSLGTELSLAFWMASARVGLPSGLAHPHVEHADQVLGRPFDLAGEQDHAGAGAEHGQAGPGPLAERLEQPVAGGELADHGGLAAGEHQPVDPVEVGEAADLDDVGADRGQRPQVLADVALVGQDTDDRGDGHHAYQPRSASRSPSGMAAMPTIGSPSPRDTLATISGSSWKVVASTIALARLAGSPDLKMPDPTNTPSAPSCIIIAASAGVAMPPAVNSTTGSFPARATSATISYGARSSLAATYSSASSSALSLRSSTRMARMCRVASTTLPVPASPFDRIIAAPSAMRRSASPRLVAPHTNGTVNAHLSMWCASSAGVSTSDSST